MIKMCQKHWAKCKKAVEAKGLGHLISDSGKDLADKMMDVENKRDYDPLFALIIVITGHALECGGLSLMLDEEEYCPLCESIEHTGKKDMDDDWINESMKEIYKKCVSFNLQG
ncbi:MAG: hypothetical protein ACXQT0_04805 [Candidatus Methanofastidiosia archaeon]